MNFINNLSLDVEKREENEKCLKFKWVNVDLRVYTTTFIFRIETKRMLFDYQKLEKDKKMK